jgi:hypothetical protein
LMAHSWISSSFKLSCGTLLLISALLQVQNGAARFQPQWQSATGSSHLLYHISTTKSVVTAFLPLCVLASIHTTQRANTLKPPIFSIISSTLPLLTYGVNHNSSAVIPQSLKINSTIRCHADRYYRRADANILQCVMKVWSSCFQLLNQSTNSIHIHTCVYCLQCL